MSSILIKECDLKHHKNLITGICVTDSEDTFYTASRDKRILRWCPDSLKPLTELPGSNFFVNSLSARGPVIAAGSGNEVLLYTPKSEGGESFQRITTHEGDVLATAINTQASRIATASCDGTIAVSNALGSTVLKFAVPKTYVTALCFIPNTDILLSGDFSGRIRVWDSKERNSFSFSQNNKPSAGVTAMAVSPDGSYVGYATRDSMVYFVEIESGKLIRSLQTESIVYSVAFALTEQVLACGTQKAIILWDVIANKTTSKYTDFGTDKVGAIAWFKNGLLVGLNSGILRMLTYQKEDTEN